MNTRIQVEHRVTEMVYALKFSNPADEEEFFILDSLVGAMLFIACYGTLVPKPERVVKNISATEIRINATNSALKPHAGGILRYWSPPIEGELRDDQGIGIMNPDSQLFQPYHLAGAYDSNVALTVVHGESRLDNFQRLAEVLRQMDVRGASLQLNLQFHYGLTHWLIGQHPMVKPNTQFVISYLAAVGKLSQLANQVDLEVCWQESLSLLSQERISNILSAMNAKQNLILRPLQKLISQPHLLAGWLSPRPRRRWQADQNAFQWLQNPLKVLSQLYHYLRLEERPGVAAVEKIWKDDHDLLSQGLRFYEQLEQRIPHHSDSWHQLDSVLNKPISPMDSLSQKEWDAIRAAHRGFQAGLDLLRLPVALSLHADFDQLHVRDNLSVFVSQTFAQSQTRDTLILELAPPPVAKSNEIVSWTGEPSMPKKLPIHCLMWRKEIISKRDKYWEFWK